MTTVETMTTTIATTSMSGNRARDASARDAETPRAPGIFYFFLSSYCINYLQLDHVYGAENMMTTRPLPPPQIPRTINGTTRPTAATTTAPRPLGHNHYRQQVGVNDNSSNDSGITANTGNNNTGAYHGERTEREQRESRYDEWSPPPQYQGRRTATTTIAHHYTMGNPATMTATLFKGFFILFISFEQRQR